MLCNGVGIVWGSWYNYFGGKKDILRNKWDSKITEPLINGANFNIKTFLYEKSNWKCLMFFSFIKCLLNKGNTWKPTWQKESKWSGIFQNIYRKINVTYKVNNKIFWQLLRSRLKYLRNFSKLTKWKSPDITAEQI